MTQGRNSARLDGPVAPAYFRRVRKSSDAHPCGSTGPQTAPRPAPSQLLFAPFPHLET
jgi:hypothetical protein